MLTPETLAQRLNAAPFSASFGYEVVSVDAESVVLRLPLRPEHAGARRPVHGGVIATLIDTVGGYAAIARNGGSVATVDMRIDFHAQPRTGEIVARAELVRLGRSISTVDVRVHDSDGGLVASGRMLLKMLQIEEEGLG